MSSPHDTRPPCRLCALTRAAWRAVRLALLPRTLAFLGALGLLGLMAATNTPSGAAAPTPASAPGGPASAAAAASSPGPSVRFRNVIRLPDARVGQPWRHEMLEGTPPFVMSFIGDRPPWVLEYREGRLAGTPTEPHKELRFTLRASSAAGPESVTQTFSLRVLPAATAKGPQAPQVLKELSPQELQQAPPVERDLPFTWRLDPSDLQWLAEPAEPVGTEDAGVAPAGPSRPSPEQWQAMLGPLVGIDYPTEAHFRKMLRIAHCTYFGSLLKSSAQERTRQGGREVVEPETYRCPTKRPTPKPTDSKQAALVSPDSWSESAAGRALPLDEAFFELLPSEDLVVERARKPHQPRANFRPLWQAKPGCGCVPPDRPEEVYAFVSYWGTADQQATPPPKDPQAEQPDPPKEARQTDFSLISRISFFGAMLNDVGEFDMPDSVRAQAHQLAREAQRHGTQLDLVLHRNEWDTLLKRSDAQLASLAERAARNAVRLASEPQQQLAFGQSLLLPFWRQENKPFSGLTVFFDNLPAVGSESGRRFRLFHSAFVHSLIAQIQAEQTSGRHAGKYRLNIVVPDHQMAESTTDGLYTFEEMKRFIERAEPPTPRASGSKFDDTARARNVGSTEIQLNYIVLLSDRTTATKKQLRLRIDRSSLVWGVHRVVLLDSLLPTLLRPTAVKAVWSPDEPVKQFGDDLAYMKWSYGGVTLWELPSTAQRDEGLAKRLGDEFRLDARRLPKLCDFVCPHRIALRLALQGLFAVGVVAISLWLLNCAVRNLGRPYLAFLWLGAAIMVPLALLLLECDPALHELNKTNLPLIVLVVLVFVGGLYWSLKSRQPRP